MTASYPRGLRSAAALVAALAGMAVAALPIAAEPSTAASEQRYRALDAALYDAARQYFPGDEVAPPARRLFRLTREQIDATVAVLLPRHVTRSVKTAIPRDPLQTNYDYAELLGLNASNIGALSGWIGEIADRVRADPAGLVACNAQAGDTACLAAFARSFATRAFRGDIARDRLARLERFYLDGVRSAGLAQATGDLVEVVLNSPDFLFRKELDTRGAGRLAPVQHLQAVAYTLADVPPERLGLDAGKAAQYLGSERDSAAAIAAIVMSKEAREKLKRFFATWLEIKEPGEFTISDKVFTEFTPKLAAGMREEAERYLAGHLAKPAPKLKDITRAALPAGAARGAGRDGEARLGIFTLPAVLASHSGPTGTRPIKRGVFWVRKVMCMELEPPPKDLHAKLYDMAGATERQRIESSTAGAACAGCHKIINPFGFFLETYDALGRWRSRENGQPIDTRIKIDFLDEEPVETAGPVEALEVLTGSLMFKQCFVRQLFRFYMGRNETPADDAVLRRMFFELAYRDEQDILRALWSLVSSDRMALRQ